MKPMYTYAKLKGRIVEKFGTQDRFAECVGISTTSMSNKLTCKTGLSQNDIIQWCGILEIPVADIGPYFFT